MSSTFQHSDDGVLGRTPYMYALYLQEFTKHANAQSERIYASYGPDLPAPPGIGSTRFNSLAKCKG